MVGIFPIMGCISLIMGGIFSRRLKTENIFYRGQSPRSWVGGWRSCCGRPHFHMFWRKWQMISRQQLTNHATMPVFLTQPNLEVVFYAQLKIPSTVYSEKALHRTTAQLRTVTVMACLIVYISWFTSYALHYNATIIQSHVMLYIQSPLVIKSCCGFFLWNRIWDLDGQCTLIHGYIKSPNMNFVFWLQSMPYDVKIGPH